MYEHKRQGRGEESLTFFSHNPRIKSGLRLLRQGLGLNNSRLYYIGRRVVVEVKYTARPNVGLSFIHEVSVLNNEISRLSLNMTEQ